MQFHGKYPHYFNNLDNDKKFDVVELNSNILQLLIRIPGRILFPPLTQFFGQDD